MSALILVAIIVYFLPGIIASVRHHRQSLAIGALNLFLGWTFLGWVVSLVWSLTDDKQPRRPSSLRLPWWPQDEAPPVQPMQPVQRHYPRRFK